MKIEKMINPLATLHYPHVSEVGNFPEPLPAMMQFILPTPYIGINNQYSNFMSRLGYFIWVMNGSNMLRSLRYYTMAYDDFTDDGDTLRGAYGPRIRYWVGADALQEAINVNKDVDKGEDFIKPKGVDQLEAMFRDLQFGMKNTSMSIFDPALDYEETNNVPDLHNVFMHIDGKFNALNMVMNYSELNASELFLNDLWVFNIIKHIYAKMLVRPAGSTTVNVCQLTNTGHLNNDKYIRYEDVSDSFEFGKENDIEFFTQYNYLREFEMHLRMQVNEESFLNSDVSVTKLSELLTSKLLGKIKNVFLSDYGRCLMLCAIIKQANNLKLYNEFMSNMYCEIKNKFMKAELIGYALHKDIGTDVDAIYEDSSVMNFGEVFDE